VHIDIIAAAADIPPKLKQSKAAKQSKLETECSGASVAKQSKFKICKAIKTKALQNQTQAVDSKA
jgi:hypothetical protein